jgi:chromosome segregation protein
MPRLDSLEILGFKSFANRTRVLFEDGITIVVGPNGCGKSNLTDALSWVLGMVGAHRLRGRRMDDFIFNGTSKRRPSGMMEATLTLSREDETSIAFNGLEADGPSVSITRRLYRSGDSAYFINGNRCRLKDVEALLERIGLGLGSYALIRQGRVEGFLNSGSLDRRAIIEEAAGIGGYKARRRNAELKLEMARQNLLRIDDILSEVERQLRSLKRQAAKARRHKELKEEFRDVQQRRFGLEAHGIVVSLAEVEAAQARLGPALTEVTADIRNRERTLQEISERMEDLENRLSELREKSTGARVELDRTRNSIRFCGQQIESTQRLLDTHGRNRRELLKSLETIESEHRILRAEDASLKAERPLVGSRLTLHAQVADECKARLEAAEQRVEQLRARHLELSAELTRLRNARDRAVQRVESIKTQRSRLERERASHESGMEQARDRLQKRRLTGSRRREEAGAVRGRLETNEDERRKLERELAQVRGELAEAREGWISGRGRLQSLEELEVSQSLYSEGVAKALRHLRNSSVPVSGTLADFARISPEFERLVEQFLQPELEFVLVDSLQQAVGGVSELKALDGGRCTFLSLKANGFSAPARNGGKQLAAEKGVVGTLGELLTLEPPVRKAFRRVLPERADAVVVSDLDRAFTLSHRYPSRTFLTIHGEALAPGGLLSVSRAGRPGGGLLSFRREKGDLEKKLARAKARVNRLTRRKEGLRERIRETSSAARKFQQTLHQTEKDVLQLELQEEQAGRDLEHHRRALEVLAFEETQLREEESSEHDGAQAASRSLTGKEDRARQIEAELGEATELLTQARSQFSESREQLHRSAAEERVIEEKARSVENSLSRSEARLKSLALRLQETEAQKADGEKRLKTLTLELENLEKTFETCQAEAVRLSTAEANDRQEYDEYRSDRRGLETRLQALRQQQQQLQEESSDKEVRRARLETRLENLSRQCQEDLQEPLESIMEGVTAGEDGARISDRYLELRSKLEKFGPVNMTALEQYQDNEERHSYLSGQREDLERSIADTTRAIQEINRHSREKFKTAFDSVNTHFHETFRKLFDGGSSGMKLIDEEDVLESGIDLFAQPPGKKVQYLSQLSGGEQTLTAVAFLVALFRYRPSRFCVLDEVDAALDDTNVERFVRLIRDMSQETQFILVSHNKRTIEMADSLYGVTMEEPGISQVLAVRLREAKTLAE